MTSRTRACASAMALFLTIGTPTWASAQVRWDRGQNVAPVFEGWERNSDAFRKFLEKGLQKAAPKEARR